MVFYRVRGFFPSHAVLVGLAVGALVYTLLGVFENLGLASIASMASRGRVPRNQQERQNKQRVDKASEGPASEQEDQPSGYRSRGCE